MANPEKELIRAKDEADRLATHLWEKHYQEDSPDFELCDTVAGVISQIDNMTAGLTRLRASPAPSSRRYLKQFKDY